MEFRLSYKLLGIILIAIALGLGILTWSFTQTLFAISAELHKDCPMSPDICPAKGGGQFLPIQSTIGFGIAAVLGVIGALLIFAGVKTEIILNKQSERLKEIIRGLKGEEKQIYNIVAEAEGTIFQSELVEKAGLSKVRVSRILDKLEAKGVVERRRRGMTNVVLAKYIEEKE